MLPLVFSHFHYLSVRQATGLGVVLTSLLFHILSFSSAFLDLLEKIIRKSGKKIREEQLPTTRQRTSPLVSLLEPVFTSPPN